MTTYYNDYPREPIGKGNPYKCCAHCKVSDPSINGRLEKHQEWCSYRKLKEAEERVELLELEVECLKLEASQPVWAVVKGWCSIACGGGEDISSMKLLRNEKDALSYEKELESSNDYEPDYHYVTVRQFYIG